MNLNKEIAEKVMGWKVYYHQENITLPVEWWTEKHSVGEWNPVKDLNQCFEVVEKMYSEGWEFEFETSSMRKNNIAIKSFLATFWTVDKGGYSAKEESPNKAILKAALATSQQIGGNND